ncbi:MAG TPA: carbohydrate kinase family protein [Lichenihabitans sp.]|jgi:ribokinase|nr:carbohydrate kinase family protein [Lichenihabitans sp.]
MPHPRLVCLGNLTIDDVVLPDGREVPGCIGGDALYAALAARLWEPSTEMVAPVGPDFPGTVLDRINQAGLSSAGLTPRTVPTLHNRVAYETDGNRTWTLFSTEDDFHALSPRPDDIPPAYRVAEAFLVLAMTLEAQEALVGDLKHDTNAMIALDPQEDYIAGNEARLRRMIGETDIFMPSAEEARRLLGHADWSAAARTFASWGPNIVVLKLGHDGCLVHERDGDRMIQVPVLRADVKDTTGAGDCFCGAFMAALLQEGADLCTAARAGTVAASFAIGGYGVEPMFSVSPREALRRMRA